MNHLQQRSVSSLWSLLAPLQVQVQALVPALAP
jgi:hypothetical protein